jgi:hypothetical protein
MRPSRTAARRNCSAAATVGVEVAASPCMFARHFATEALRADLAKQGVSARTCADTTIRMRRTL